MPSQFQPPAGLQSPSSGLTLRCSSSLSCGVNIHASHSGWDGSSQYVTMPSNTLGMPSTINSHCLQTNKQLCCLVMVERSKAATPVA